jgi:hypothetical protein
MGILVLAFLLTVAIEWAVLAWLSRLGFRRTGWFCLGMNGASWGAAMGVLTVLPVDVYLLEIGIVFVEAALVAWFWQWGFGRAWLVALAMNVASLGVGVLMGLMAPP